MLFLLQKRVSVEISISNFSNQFAKKILILEYYYFNTKLHFQNSKRSEGVEDHIFIIAYMSMNFITRFKQIKQIYHKSYPIRDTIWYYIFILIGKE